MPSQIALIWALGTSAVIVAAGAAAVYWTHPDFMQLHSSPAVIAERAPEAPAPASAAAGAPAVIPVAPVATAAPSATPAPAAPAIASLKPAVPPAASSGAQALVSSARPAFDVVTVDPTGEAVVAGRAAPNAKVELRDAGKTVAEATTDSQGQFVIIPPALAPGAHSLSLASGAGKSAAETSKVIAVAVPAPEAKAVVAAMVPAKPPLPQPAAAAPATQAPATAAPAAGSRIAIQSVEASANGGLSVKGAADPSGVVRLYLNGSFVADARTQADGLWSLKVEHGMTPGAYTLRAEEINPANAKVVARADAPFSYPAAPAPAVANAPPAHETATASAATGAPSLAHVVVDSVQTDHVVRGDTLWGISRTFYGDGTRFRLIFGANTNQIRNPNLIYPGENLIVPKSPAKP